MKKVLFFLLSFPFYTLAQPTLDNDVFVEVGDIIRLQPAQLNNISEGFEGANKTWDFTNLLPLPASTFQLKYVDAAGTPFVGLFPFSNLATEYVSDDNTVSYGYFNQTGNELWFLGAALEGGSQTFTDPDLAIRTPMSFTESHTNNYGGTFDFSGFTGIIYGTKSNTYDAYGTLKMPGITYSNAIRTYTYETRTDSVAFESGAYSLDITEEKYYAWYVSGIHSAVMEIRYSTIITKTVIPGFPAQISTLPTEKTVTYQLNPTSATTEKPQPIAGVEIRRLSANPVGDQAVILEFTSQARIPLTLSLLSAQGQLLQQTNISLNSGIQTQTIDVSAYPAGVYYLVVLEDAKGKASQVIKVNKL